MKRKIKYAELYEVEDDIRTIIGDSSINKEQDHVLSSIIYQYTQSYMFEKTFAGSALYEFEDSYHVRLLTNHDIYSESAMIDANKFLAANYNLIDLSDKKYEKGFSKYYYKQNYKSDDKNFVYINKLLKDFPKANIPSSSYTEFADYKGCIDEWDHCRIVNFPNPEKSKKTIPLSINEIENNKFGANILEQLKNQKKYQIIFENDENKKNINLSNKKNHTIEKVIFKENITENLNTLSNINYKPYNDNYNSIYSKLNKEGLVYIRSIAPDYQRTEEGIETVF